MLSTLQRVRMERGLTQWQVAKQVGISRAMVSNWERGHYKPSQEQLQQLAAFYGVEVGELLETKEATR